MSQPNELRVFISSTFRDLQEEREHLVKKIFPEIRALCRERGIIFTEVDLRWGLTDEDVGLGRVIRACLEEVDRCRPYFIGITGDRYGFIPTHLDIYKDPTLLGQYPWIEDAVNDQMSITEMEAQYGALDPSLSSLFAGGELSGARFYFRRHRQSLDDDREEDQERQRLEAYQQRIRQSGAVIEQFRDPTSLGELIYDDLIRIIKQDFADAKPPTPLEQERARHEAFSLSRRRAYIPNPTYLELLSDHAASDGVPLVVYAESGSGKSSLFAFWAEQYRRRHPEAHVIEHYVGIGATATDHYAVVRHICMEIKERFDRNEEIPSEPSKLESALGQWLGYADHELRKRGEHLVLILDGLNQLQGAALNLRWIPDAVSPSIRLIVSSTVEGSLVELRKRGWSEFGMQALTEAERAAIVVRYLAEYRKSLNPEQIARIAGDYKCGHPLFLKTLLEELRLVGRHEELDARITSYLSSTGTEDLFQRVLERLEEDYNMRSVRDVMTLLSASRSGLDERELSDISGLARLKIATMIAGLDYHLVRKEGRLTFFHDYLRRAVEKRYLADEAKRRAAHLQLAEYFQSAVTAAADGSIPVRMAGELAYQLHSAGAIDRLVACLTTIPVFVALYAGVTRYEVLSYCSTLEIGNEVEKRYREELERWAMEDAVDRSTGLWQVADLFERLGRWAVAIEIQQARCASAIEHGDKNEEAASRLSLGWLRQLRGEYVESLDEMSQGLDLCTAASDLRGISIATGNMGVVYYSRGEYDRAMECYERQMSICSELDDTEGISVAIGNMGSVHFNRGEYDRAIECFERKLSICSERGDRRGLSRAIGNMGMVYFGRGEYDRALASFERHLSICSELGDRGDVSFTIGNLGVVYSHLGDDDRALECYERQLSICDELGDRAGATYAIGNIGVVQFKRGEYDRALESYGRKLNICEELGDRHGVSVALVNIGNVYASRGEHDRAIECYQRQMSICEELGDRPGLYYGAGNLGYAYFSCGEYDRALEQLHRAAEEHRAIGDRGAFAEWLRGIADTIVEIVATADKLPEYVAIYVPEVRVKTSDIAAIGHLESSSTDHAEWRVVCLRYARECVEECVAICEEVPMRDTQFNGWIVRARIDAAEGHEEIASQRLHAMLHDAIDDVERAAIRYWLWKLGEPGHAAEALALYQALYAATPNHDYRKRVEELEAV